MRRFLIVLIILAVVVTAGLWLYKNATSQAQQPVVEREEAPVERGTLVALVNSTGTVTAAKQTMLAFEASGRVVKVWVTEGQAVRAGEPLAQLDGSDIEASVAEAELAVEMARAQLLRAQQPPAEYELAAAKAALDSAKAAYDRLRAGATKEEIQVARTGLDQAKAALDQAQAAYNRVADRPDIGIMPESLALKQATISYDSAKASFDLTQRKPTAAELAAARASIAQAQAALSRLEAGATAEDLLIAQLQVQQAQLRLDQARDLLDKTTLSAAHDGVVTTVGVQEGGLAGLQAQPAFVISDLSHYYVEVMLDEVDVGQVAAGQAVTVTLDALPSDVLAGKVESVAETASLSTGVVTYKLKISLAPTTAPLRVGMTANVDIVTERRDGVLLVPNRFVRLERSTGQTFVDRLSGGQATGSVVPIEIQIGLRDEFYSEVLAGLEEGDVVVLVQESSREQLRSMFMSGP